MRSRVLLRTAVVVSTLVLLGCAGTEETTPDTPNETVELARKVGWLDGQCLVFPDTALQAGTGLTVVSLGTEQQVTNTSVVGPATPEGSCALLMSEREGTINGTPASLYEVAAWTQESGLMGIAWTGSSTTITVADGRASGDLDGDDVSELFTVCASSEGLHLAVWSGSAYTGTAVWMGYYYLGYDLEPDCPPGAFPGG